MKSKNITGSKGSVYIKAQYWTLNSNAEIQDNTLTVQETSSKVGRITNATYPIMLRNAIRAGSFLHFQERGNKNASQKLWTYKLLKTEIHYLIDAKITFNEKTSTVIIINNRGKREYKEDKVSNRKVREMVKKKFITFDRKSTERDIELVKREEKDFSLRKRKETIRIKKEAIKYAKKRALKGKPL